MNTTIYTVGHSTHPVDEFLNILKAFGIGLVVDVRTIPKSRHNPQFNQIEFERDLRGRHIEYVHLKALGGLRLPKTNARTGVWRATESPSVNFGRESANHFGGRPRLSGIFDFDIPHLRGVLLARHILGSPASSHKSFPAEAIM